EDIVTQCCEVHGLRVKLELPGLDLRQVEHLVDEAKKMSTGAMHALQRLLRLFCAEARRIGNQHVSEPNDGIERRAQLVADAGDELRLVLARLRELSVLVLDFVEQPHILDRDHGLIGKGGGKLDLSLGEWADHPAHQHDNANRNSFAQEGNTEHGTNAYFSRDITQ